MTIFDKSSFGTRARQDRLTTAKKSEWAEGFDAGYKAASERYIVINPSNPKRRGKK